MLGIPRGGVIVAAEVARELGAPLDVVISRKVGVPSNPELAVGAVAPDGSVLYDETLLRLLGLEKTALQKPADREMKEIVRRLRLYRGEREPARCRGRTVIVVDDGIATGLTLQAAIKSLRRLDPSHLVLAVPVAPSEPVARLRSEVDKLVCLQAPEIFYAVGQFYRDFSQTTDEEVVAALTHN